MTQRELSDIGSPDVEEHGCSHLGVDGDSAQTLDMYDLFNTDADTTGSFNVSSIAFTDFVKLLDALPIPALLVDKERHIVFANQYLETIDPDCLQIQGRRFEDLIVVPRDEERALALLDKAQALLEQAFATRKPQRAEAILEIGRQKIWARLHLRSVRTGETRHLLVLLEDHTYEKKQLQYNQRSEEALRRANAQLEMDLMQREREFWEIKGQLAVEVTLREQFEERLQLESEKFRALAELGTLGVAVIREDGEFQYLNSKLEDFLRNNLESLSSNTSLLKLLGLGEDDNKHEPDLPRPQSGSVHPVQGALKEQSGTLEFLMAPIGNGEYLMTCANTTGDEICEQEE